MLKNTTSSFLLLIFFPGYLLFSENTSTFASLLFRLFVEEMSLENNIFFFDTRHISEIFDYKHDSK